MTLANGCVLVACLLPFACALIAKAGGVRRAARDDAYDNRNPRAWLARREGAAARANAAQANSFEALPFFIAAVLLSQQAHATQARIDLLAVVFVTCRLFYIASYLADRAALRSSVWFLGIAANVALMLLAL